MPGQKSSGGIKENFKVGLKVYPPFKEFLLKWHFDFFGQKMTFFQKIFGDLTGFSQICSYIFKENLTPPPSVIKIFLTVKTPQCPEWLSDRKFAISSNFLQDKGYVLPQRFSAWGTRTPGGTPSTHRGYASSWQRDCKILSIWSFLSLTSLK